MRRKQMERQQTGKQSLERFYDEALYRCKLAGADCTQIRVCVGSVCINASVPASSGSNGQP